MTTDNHSSHNNNLCRLLWFTATHLLLIIYYQLFIFYKKRPNTIRPFNLILIIANTPIAATQSQSTSRLVYVNRL